MKGKRSITHVFCMSIAFVLMSLSSTVFAQVESDDASSVDLGQIVITATKVAQDVDNLPVSVDVITREEIEALPLQNIDDLLGSLVGIDVSVSSGQFEHKGEVTMRGMSSEDNRTLILVDGMLRNNSDSGAANFRSVDPSNIERIEIVRGPASSLYGTHAMGGVINIITKKPEQEVKGNLEISGGTFETLKQKVNVTGGAGPLDLLLSVSNSFSQGFNSTLPENRDAYGSDNTQVTERHYFMKAVQHIGDSDTTLDYSIGIYDDFRGLGSALDPTVYPTASPDGSYREYDGNRYQINLKNPGSRSEFKTSLFYNKENYNWLRESTGTNGLRNRYLVNSDREDKGIDSNYTWKLNKHTLTTGLSYSMASVDAADDYDVYNYAASTLSVMNKGDMNTASLYLHDTYMMSDRVDMSYGLRFDDAKVKSVEYNDQTGFMGTASPDDKSWNHVSPSLGLVYFTGVNTKVRFNYSNAFHAPILDALTRRGIFRGRIYDLNPALEPEQINSFEVGFDHNADRFDFGLSLYYNQGKDFIHSIDSGTTMSGRTVYDWVNLGEAKIYGMEFDTSLQTTKSTKVYFNTTLNYSKVGHFATNDAGLLAIQGKYFTNVPKFKANVGWVMIHPGDESLSFNLRYAGSSYSDDQNTTKSRSYIWADAQASKQVSRKTNLVLRVNNLFDKVHISSDSRTVGLNWELKAVYSF